MAVKQPVFFNFGKGVDTKTDPFQVPVGNLLSLTNSVFTTANRLTKRNGYQMLPAVPQQATLITTFNDNLTAIGTSIQALSSGSDAWIDKGSLLPVSLSTLPLVRSDLNQAQLDSAVSPNNLVCTAYTDQDPSNLSSPIYMYVVADATTGQNIVSPTQIVPTSGSVANSPRVFVLGKFFVIMFTTSANALEYIAVSTFNTSITRPATTIANSVSPSPGVSWDGVVVTPSMGQAKLYVAYNTVSGGQGIWISFLDQSFSVSAPTKYTDTGKVTATIMSICADTSGSSPVIYAAYYDSGSSTGWVFSVDRNCNKIIAPPVQIISSGSVANITCSAKNGVLTVVYEVNNAYGYDGTIPTNYLKTVTISASGSVGSTSQVARSIGLASKSFYVNDVIYFLTAYQSPFQPSYFLMNISGQVIAKLAYGNGGGYVTLGLPSVTVTGNIAQIGYRYKDFITSQNTSTTQSITKSGIYSQTGLNIVDFNIGISNVVPGEIAQALHLSGGFLWEYDGVAPVEHNFFLWPDSVEGSGSNTGGSMTSQKYQYQVVYQWTDNQGNVHNSAPSIPITVDMTTFGTSTCSAVINVPTLRLTYKINTPLKIAIFRWSVAQQEFYEVTSIELPLLNNTAVDSVSFTDTLADSSIIGNSLIYTTGGVVEDIGAPSFNSIALFDDRLWGVNAEDTNSLWYSKQVIENTPVEMSDLFTFYVAPSTGAQGSTGAIQCLYPMDDALVIFKKDAILYINGTGPDNTGANNQYSQPIFVTSSVGTINQQSIAMTDAGLMFQSDKGIWLFERSKMSAVYVGYPVEQYTKTSTTNGANTIPATTQSRFTLDSGITAMYDYFFKQWGTFEGVPAISSTLYQGEHTVLDQYGRVFQENPGSYLDGSNPVLMSFTTGWLNMAGISGYERIYEFLLLGNYLSPNQLQISVAYDFGNPIQSDIVTPTNITGIYGSDSLYGQTSPFGGPSPLFQWRVHARIQKCQTFQISVQEIFNPAYGPTNGAGFTLSGITCVVGIKKGYRPIRAINSIG